MSGPIRRLLGPTKARLQGYIKEARTMFMVPINVSDLEKEEVGLEDLIQRLSTNIALLERCNKEWTTLLNELKGDEKVKEEKEYAWAADGDDGIVELILDSNETVARLQGRLAQVLRKQEKSAKTLPARVTGPLDSVEPKEKVISQVRLPKLNLPTFDGNILCWQEFWDVFNSSVHEQEIPNVTKFSYLKSTLRGTAANAIHGISITNDNYKTAIELLKERFGKGEVIIETLYSQLQHMPVATNRIGDIKTTYENIEKILRQLESQRENIDNQRILVQQILSKFPVQVLIKLEESKDIQDSWTVKVLRKTLQQYITISTNARRYDVNTKSGNFNVVNNRRFDTFNVSKQTRFPTANQASTEALVTNTSSAAASRQRNRVREATRPCIFCGGNHFNDCCSEFADIYKRKKQLQKEGRCFICLRGGHISKECPNAQLKACYYCGKTGHHRSICPTKFEVTDKSDNDVNKTTAILSSSEANKSQESDGKNDSNTMVSNTLLAGGEKVLLQTAQVVVDRDGLKCQARVLMDSASHRTFMTEQMAKQLNLLPQRSESLSVSTFGTRKPQRIETYVVDFNIVAKDGLLIPLQANVLHQITGPIRRGPLHQADVEFLQAITPGGLADSIPVKSDLASIDILLGSDYFWSIIERDRIILPSGLLLLSSKLGYILTGKYLDPTEGDVDDKISSCLVVSQNDSPCLSDLWDLETIGISDPIHVRDDDKALSKFNSTICYQEGRYFITWPWKSEDVELPENFSIAFGRMKSLSRRLKVDKKLLQQYCDIIQSQFEAGIVELVDGQKLKSDSRKHYLPHHPVVTPLKTTTKVRIVYDASVKANKGMKSLNECLYRGPIAFPNMCGILLRFRVYLIAILADIEKAFLQIGVQEHDRDVTRFLWYTDPTKPEKIEGNLSVYRFCRVPFGIICSPFLLEGTLRFHLKKEGSCIAKLIGDNIYVDNVCVGVSSAEEALHFYKEAKGIFKGASMNLREWTSNCDEFLNHLPEKERLKGNVIKVFGLVWNQAEDYIQIPSFKVNLDEFNITKRQVLSGISKLYDPLGLISPVTLLGKLFLQKLWSSNKLNWDEHLSPPLSDEWKGLVQTWQKLHTLRIPRYIGQPDQDDSICQLIVFCDASARAYAATVYLRIVNRESVQVNLVFSKLRLAPLETKRLGKGKVTLPRLELLAVVIGVRAISFVTHEIKLPISKRIVFTDSECVLHWVKTTRQLPVFIQNRINEIRKEQDLIFGYVSSNQNPADYATRGLSVSDISDCSLWWHGPDWLLCDKLKWPTKNLPEITPEKLENYLSQIKNVGSQVMYEATNLVEETSKLLPLGIDETKYSSLWRLLRITAICLKFIKYQIWSRCSQELRDKILQRCVILKKVFSDMKERSLCYAEIRTVTLFWIYVIQRRQFCEVFTAIRKNETSCLQRQLGLQVDEFGLLRCCGRFQNADISEQAKYPKLLPRQEYFTRLLIQYVHERLIHAGVSHTLAAMRQEYWIVKGRMEVKTVLSRCLVCRRHEGPSFSLPRMPPWPRERVAQSLPFQFIGLDYLGPVLVKEGGEIIKTWICLFTCLAVRAIHLEWVKNLTPEQFLSCLRRFVARRGKPQLVISDNAPQFKVVKMAIDKQWKQVMLDEEVKHYIKEGGIKWQFTTALSPWKGGFYERLIALVKRSLQKGIGQKRLTLDQLVTILVEVEAIVNTRPLTYVYDEFDSGFTLTPAHFLMSHFAPLMITSTDEREDDDDDYSLVKDSATFLLKTWKKGQRQLNSFWNTWRNEYLLSLRERSSLYHRKEKNKTSCAPQVGQVVIIKDEMTPRRIWKLGRIERLITSIDGKVRTADIYLPGNRHLQRSINMLYPLELYNGQINNKSDKIKSDMESQDAGHVENSTSSKISSDLQKAPTRQAAISARQKINELMENNALNVLFNYL